MIAIPAVDVKGGRCVQLVGGRPEDERVSLPDPPAVASDWFQRGFTRLHVVDLDAALGSGDNLDVVRSVVSASPARTQVGGGVRSDERADALFEAGVDVIVVGTRAIAEPEWFADLARRWPERVSIAVDTRDGMILSKGWTESTSLRVDEYLPGLADLPLAGVLSTDVGREGRLQGIDRAACMRIIEASPHPVVISGGVTTLQDMDWLESVGADGAVLGMAIYAGEIDIDELARRFGG